jgi:hypothetical protein
MWERSIVKAVRVMETAVVDVSSWRLRSRLLKRGV